MKTLISVLWCLFFMLTVAQAETEDSGPYLAGVEKRAYDNPGIPIPVISEIELRRLDFWHGAVVRSGTNAAIYSAGKVSYVAQNYSIQEQAKFLTFIPFLMMVILLMVIGSIKVSYSNDFAAFAMVAAFVAIALATITFAVHTTVAAAIAAVANSTAASIIGSNKKYPYWFCVGIACIASLFGIFYGL